MDFKSPWDRLFDLLERFVSAHERIAEAAERMAARNEFEASSGPRRAGKAARGQRIRPPEEPVTELDQAKARQVMRRIGVR